jgi:hypothetical protein
MKGDQQELFLKMALDAWNIQIDRTSKLFNSLSDDELKQEVAPGRNSGIYLLGHLTAVHDALFPLLAIGEKLYPQLDEIFVKNPDKANLKKPETKQLRNYWTEVNEKLAGRFLNFSTEEWFQRHMSISETDFLNEPHRNKLNVLLNRTAHLANHLGQLIFLKK